MAGKIIPYETLSKRIQERNQDAEWDGAFGEVLEKDSAGQLMRIKGDSAARFYRDAARGMVAFPEEAMQSVCTPALETDPMQQVRLCGLLSAEVGDVKAHALIAACQQDMLSWLPGLLSFGSYLISTKAPENALIKVLFAEEEAFVEVTVDMSSLDRSKYGATLEDVPGTITVRCKLTDEGLDVQSAVASNSMIAAWLEGTPIAPKGIALEVAVAEDAFRKNEWYPTFARAFGYTPKEERARMVVQDFFKGERASAEVNKLAKLFGQASEEVSTRYLEQLAAIGGCKTLVGESLDQALVYLQGEFRKESVPASPLTVSGPLSWWEEFVNRKTPSPQASSATPAAAV